MANRGRKRSYEAYVRDYKAKQRKLAANGVIMHQRMYTETEWNAQYERLLNKRKKEVKRHNKLIKEGEFAEAKKYRATTGNINRDLIDKQAFALSAKQASALKKEHYKDNYYKTRSGQNLEEFETEKVHEYFIEHPDETDITLALAYARQEISTEFFGS